MNTQYKSKFNSYAKLFDIKTLKLTASIHQIKSPFDGL